MKLVKLSCKNKPKFKEIVFNKTGLTLIVGESNEGESSGGSNGVGKTLSLSILHHCLAANVVKNHNDFFRKELADWIFTLEFTINNRVYVVERSGDSSHLKLNENNIGLKELREWFNKNGPFNLDQVPTLSFRSLISRFSRLTREDCISPISTEKEKPYNALLATTYLLGLDITLVVNKASLKLDIDTINKKIKYLKDPLLVGTNSKIHISSLTQKVKELELNIKNFEVADNYKEIQELAELNNKNINELNKSLSVLNYQLQNIEESLLEREDISSQELIQLYEGLELIFTPESLLHFENVEEFYTSLKKDRRTRLIRDKLSVTDQIDKLKSQIENSLKLKDEYLNTLHSKGAFDDYANLVKTFEKEKSELTSLERASEELKVLNEETIELKKEVLQQTKETFEYINQDPIMNLNIKFSEYAQTMYPGHGSGLDYEVNEGVNQVRYDIIVEIQSDDSDGISDAKILCFDLLTYLNGANHTMQFLWHDNRLFAHLSPIARANWFSLVIRELQSTDKQYIASINEENFISSYNLIPEELQKTYKESVVLTLHGASSQDKLLGVTFKGRLSK